MAEASVTLQQPEGRHVFSWGKLSLDHGTLAVACFTGSWGGVGSDLRFHTGFLVAVVVMVEVHAHSGVQANSHGFHLSLEFA